MLVLVNQVLKTLLLIITKILKQEIVLNTRTSIIIRFAIIRRVVLQKSVELYKRQNKFVRCSY